jgi:hypothetical protein
MELSNNFFWELIGVLLVGIVSWIAILLRKEITKNGANPEIAEALIQPTEEFVKEEINEFVEKQKVDEKSKHESEIQIGISILILTTLILFNSCTLLTGFLSSEADKIHITYNNKDNSKAIDSLLIETKPIYLDLDINTIVDGQDYELEKLNGSIWFLKIGNKFKIEMNPKDTILKFYKK